MELLTDHPFPLMRGGGAFLIVAGLGFAIAWALPKLFGPIQAITLAAAGTTAWYVAGAVPPLLGQPPLWHVGVLVAAVVAEIIAILWLYRRIKDERRADAWMLFAVGAHFLPMAPVLGAPIVLVGLACMAWATLPLWVFPKAPLLPFGWGDSALKIGFGAWMFLAYPTWPG